MECEALADDGHNSDDGRPPREYEMHTDAATDAFGAGEKGAGAGGTCDILSYPIPTPHPRCGTTYDLAKSLPWTDTDASKEKKV